MKKKIALLLAALVLSVTPALADVDLSGMTYNELIQLRMNIEDRLLNVPSYQPDNRIDNMTPDELGTLRELIEEHIGSMTYEEMEFENWDSYGFEFVYKDVARYPEKYEGVRTVISGNVLQSVGSVEEGYTFRLSTANNYDNVILIYIPAEYIPSFRILENDNITFWVTLGGVVTYESIFGQQITLPLAYAVRAQLAE